MCIGVKKAAGFVHIPFKPHRVSLEALPLPNELWFGVNQESDGSFHAYSNCTKVYTLPPKL